MNLEGEQSKAEVMGSKYKAISFFFEALAAIYLIIVMIVSEKKVEIPGFSSWIGIACFFYWLMYYKKCV